MEHVGQFISNHWQLSLALVILLVLFFINEWLSQQKQAKTLSPTAAVQHINHDDAVVFDIREADLYRAGHIVDSILASASDFTQDKMAKYKTKPIILVCARGLQSAALATKLRQQGFTQPLALAGGIDAWKSANLPLVKGKTKETLKKVTKS